MATPQIFTAGVTPLDAAELNKFIHAEGKVSAKIWYARVFYNGTSWEVSTAVDSAAITDPDLTWDTDHLEIALTGFTAPPFMLFQAAAQTSHPIHKGAAESNSIASIYFYDIAEVLQTTESTAMDVSVWLMGV